LDNLSFAKHPKKADEKKAPMMSATPMIGVKRERIKDSKKPASIGLPVDLQDLLGSIGPPLSKKFKANDSKA
jgi:hypothetical protein